MKWHRVNNRQEERRRAYLGSKLVDKIRTDLRPQNPAPILNLCVPLKLAPLRNGPYGRDFQAQECLFESLLSFRPGLELRRSRVLELRIVAIRLALKSSLDMSLRCYCRLLGLVRWTRPCTPWKGIGIIMTDVAQRRDAKASFISVLRWKSGSTSCVLWEWLCSWLGPNSLVLSDVHLKWSKWVTAYWLWLKMSEVALGIWGSRIMGIVIIV